MLILVGLPTKKFRSGDVYYSAPSYYDVSYYPATYYDLSYYYAASYYEVAESGLRL